MKIIETELPGCLILEPQVFADARGFFYESFNRDKLSSVGLDLDFAQGNVSSRAAASFVACITSGQNRRASW